MAYSVGLLNQNMFFTCHGFESHPFLKKVILIIRKIVLIIWKPLFLILFFFIYLKILSSFKLFPELDAAELHFLAFILCLILALVFVDGDLQKM